MLNILLEDSPISGELWQHRLYFRNGDGSWEDIFVRDIHSSSYRSDCPLFHSSPSGQMFIFVFTRYTLCATPFTVKTSLNMVPNLDDFLTKIGQIPFSAFALTSYG